jgi:hypothetical protein
MTAGPGSKALRARALVVSAVALFTTACAAVAATSKLALRIEAAGSIARIEFQEGTTEETVHVSGIPAGVSTHAVSVRSGVWCVVEYVIAIGEFGRGHRPGVPICVDVGQGQRVDLGTLVFDGVELTRADAAAGAAAAGAPPPGATPDDDFTPTEGKTPQTLTTLQIKGVMVRANPEVRRCMSEHGLARGTKIFVVVAVDGATGRVTDEGRSTVRRSGARRLCRCGGVTARVPQLHESEARPLVSVRAVTATSASRSRAVDSAECSAESRSQVTRRRSSRAHSRRAPALVVARSARNCPRIHPAGCRRPTTGRAGRRTAR